MKFLSSTIDLGLCALSFPKALIVDPVPTISTEPPTSPGGWFHRRKNRLVETVEDNAQWFTKCFGFVILSLVAALGGLLWLSLT